ncbi:MAG: hypothetical protein LUE93_09810 [Bacteroides sp.]|nr:hypothetical protein [Bacteroides sp.]
MWKDYFYFSKKERQGIILLSVLIVICLLIPVLYPSDREIAPYDYTEFEEKYGDWFSSLTNQEKRER